MFDAIGSDSFYHKLSSSLQRGWIRLEERIFQLSLERFWIELDLRLEDLRFNAAAFFNFCTERSISRFVDSCQLRAENNEFIDAKVSVTVRTCRQALAVTLDIARLVETYRKC